MYMLIKFYINIMLVEDFYHIGLFATLFLSLKILISILIDGKNS